MWMICIIISIVLTTINWVLAMHHNHKAAWAALSAIFFTALTLLMEYRLVLEWVNRNDWSALMDVVPSMFGILTGYVIIMFAANAWALAWSMRKKS
ncbi:MAG: hypothetical protein QM697_17985 [Lachnospiraceae bacterium]